MNVSKFKDGRININLERSEAENLFVLLNSNSMHLARLANKPYPYGYKGSDQAPEISLFICELWKAIGRFLHPDIIQE